MPHPLQQVLDASGQISIRSAFNDLPHAHDIHLGEPTLSAETFDVPNNGKD
jgi:hypothetical protein